MLVMLLLLICFANTLASINQHDHCLIPNYIGLKGLDRSLVDYQAHIFMSMNDMKYCYVSSKTNIVPTASSQHQCCTVEIGQGALEYTLAPQEIQLREIHPDT